jgi:hypothetical protein
MTTRANGILRQSATAIEPITVDWTARCLNPWLPGAAYTNAQRIRPTIANGFEYECTTAGQTDGEVEPSWDQADTVGLTINDGSVTWTCRALSAAGLKRTITTSTWPSPPVGITISGPAIINTFAQQQAYALVTGAASATIYRVTNHVVFSDGTADDATIDIVIN